jgi:protein-L-isoaspartate(D-aspartate) O-methyltransferase
MIENQLRPNGVRDERILSAMETLPREIFVPPQLAGIAYQDEDIEVAPGRYLLEPMILAKLIQASEIAPNDRVLDIAPATGYSTAVLAGMAKGVFAAESDAALCKQAQSNLLSLGIHSVLMHVVPHATGWAVDGPYDVILINGYVEKIPDNLFQQLAEKGRLLTVVQRPDRSGNVQTCEARLFEKINGRVSSRPLFDAHVKPVPGFELPESFVF